MKQYGMKKTTEIKPKTTAKTTALTIGRYQPFHLGHLKVIEFILQEVDKLIIGIGSSQESHTRDNPFTADERRIMIERSIRSLGDKSTDIKSEYIIIPIPDVNNNSTWVSHVVKLVPEFGVVYTNGELEKKLFCDAGFEVRVPQFFERDKYSATEIRKRIIWGTEWEDMVPAGTLDVIREIGGVRRIKSVYAV